MDDIRSIVPEGQELLMLGRALARRLPSVSRHEVMHGTAATPMVEGPGYVIAFDAPSAPKNLRDSIDLNLKKIKGYKGYKVIELGKEPGYDLTIGAYPEALPGRVAKGRERGRRAESSGPMLGSMRLISGLSDRKGENHAWELRSSLGEALAERAIGVKIPHPAAPSEGKQRTQEHRESGRPPPPSPLELWEATESGRPQVVEAADQGDGRAAIVDSRVDAGGRDAEEIAGRDIG